MLRPGTERRAHAGQGARPGAVPGSSAGGPFGGPLALLGHCQALRQVQCLTAHTETSFLTFFISLLVSIPVISGPSTQRRSLNTFFPDWGSLARQAGSKLWEGKGLFFVGCRRAQVLEPRWTTRTTMGGEWSEDLSFLTSHPMHQLNLFLSNKRNALPKRNLPLSH